MTLLCDIRDVEQETRKTLSADFKVEERELIEFTNIVNTNMNNPFERKVVAKIKCQQSMTIGFERTCTNKNNSYSSAEKADFKIGSTTFTMNGTDGSDMYYVTLPAGQSDIEIKTKDEAISTQLKISQLRNSSAEIGTNNSIGF